MTHAQAETECNQPWNRRGRIPLFEWLKPDVSTVDVDRLKSLGNVVFPRVARLGLNILLRHLKQQMDGVC